MNEAKASSSRVGLYVLAIVVVGVAAFFAGSAFGPRAGLSSFKKTTVPSGTVVLDSAYLPVEGSFSKGSATAPVTVVVFNDFQCPGCNALHKFLDKASKVFNDKKLRIVLKSYPLPLHPDAMGAAKAAWAAGQQGKFWEYHDVIEKNFPNGRDAAAQKTMETFLKPESLEKYAKDLGLNIEQFKKDMASDAAAAAVKADMDLGQRLGIHATPTMYVNGRLVSFDSGISYDVVLKALKDEEARMKKIGQVPNANYVLGVDTNLKLMGSQPAGAAAAPAVAQQAVPSAVQPAPAAAVANDGGADSIVIKPNSTGHGSTPDIAKLPMRGNKNALVTIVEYSDFQCPFCSRVEPTVDEIIAKYPNDVRIFFANYPLPFHKQAGIAAVASWAAQQQGKFWEMHKKLFENQRALNRADILRYATEIGLDMNKFKADLDSDAGKAEIERQMGEGAHFGVNGTPGFLINGVEVSGALPFDAFKKIIDQELKRAQELQKTISNRDALFKKAFETAPKPKTEEEEMAEEGKIMIKSDGAPVFGDNNAPITIVEFTDFQCPFCSRANNTLHELIEKNPGKIRLVFHHYPLPFHKKAVPAHIAAEAAGRQGKFWEMYNMIFDNQSSIDPENLEAYATQIGLNMDKYKADIADPALAAKVDADLKLGESVGVRGTPHFFINGTRFSGAQPLAAFQSAVDRELELAKPFMEKGLKGQALLEAVVKSNAKPEPKPLVVNLEGAPSRGPANAPVTIVEFSDFECPFCGRVVPTLEELVKLYPNQIRIVFKQMPLPFHSHAKGAAIAALAAHKQGKFWEMHDLLFANRSALDEASLITYATQLGLDIDKFQADMKDPAIAARVEADMKDANSVGITGTPSFLINGEKVVGALALEAFKAKVDAALEKTKK